MWCTSPYCLVAVCSEKKKTEKERTMIRQWQRPLSTLVELFKGGETSNVERPEDGRRCCRVSVWPVGNFSVAMFHRTYKPVFFSLLCPPVLWCCEKKMEGTSMNLGRGVSEWKKKERTGKRKINILWSRALMEWVSLSGSKFKYKQSLPRINDYTLNGHLMVILQH